MYRSDSGSVRGLHGSTYFVLTVVFSESISCRLRCSSLPSLTPLRLCRRGFVLLPVIVAIPIDRGGRGQVKDTPGRTHSHTATRATTRIATAAGSNVKVKDRLLHRLGTHPLIRHGAVYERDLPFFVVHHAVRLVDMPEEHHLARHRRRGGRRYTAASTAVDSTTAAAAANAASTAASTTASACAAAAGSTATSVTVVIEVPPRGEPEKHIAAVPAVEDPLRWLVGKEDVNAPHGKLRAELPLPRDTEEPDPADLSDSVVQECGVSELLRGLASVEGYERSHLVVACGLCEYVCVRMRAWAGSSRVSDHI